MRFIKEKGDASLCIETVIAASLEIRGFFFGPIG